jgi:FMN-dependent oxidoreductase (nitrilotriacetate monooxygenase family)
MTSSSKKVKRSPLIIQVITPASTTGHWVHPDDKSRDFNKLDTWLEFAKTAERGKLNAIFIADHLALYDSYKGPHNFKEPIKTGHFAPRIDPSSVVSAMASVTKSLGFGITFSTIAEHPYHFARRLASIDDFSNGRVAWNIVTSFLKSVGRQLNIEFPEHNERYRKSQEYVDVVYKLLLSSWSDDAVEYNKETGVFANPDRVREINHKGEFFNVPGPAITEPTPQRFPVIFQAGTSEAGILFAAENAELIFVSQGKDKSVLKAQIAKIRKLAKEKFNRDPYSIKFVVGASFHVGKTHQEAVDKLQKQRDSFPDEAKAVGFSGVSDIDLGNYALDENVPLKPKESNAHQTITDKAFKKKQNTKREILQSYDRSGEFVGTSEEIADQIEDFLEEYDVDGFNFEVTIYPNDLSDLVDLLIPELQRRGLFWHEYAVPGGTFRQNVFGRSFLSEDHPAYGLKWSSDVPVKEFEDSLVKLEKERVKNRTEARAELGL